MRREDLKFIINNDKIFSIQIYVPVGSIHEKKGQYGISHFLEHMKFKKSNKYNKNNFLQQFDKTTVMNAYTTKDHTSYYLRTNNNKWKEVIELMYELVFNTSFNTNDIDIERKVILEEKLSREGNLESANDIDIHSETSILDENNPYSRPVIGDMKDIKKITNKELKKYNKQYFNDYLVVISCSNGLKQKINNYCLKKFPKPLNKTIKKLENTQSFHYSLTIRNMPIPQNNIFITFKSFSENDNNKYYIDFIESFFANSMNSLLGVKLRKKKGYVYSVQTFNESYKDFGCFRILISSNKKNDINDIVNIVFSEINILKDGGLNNDKFKKFKSKFLNDMTYYFKNNDTLITKYGRYLYYDKKFTIKKYEKIIKDLTNDKLTEIINLLFDYEQIGFVSYGNFKDINKVEKSVGRLIKQNRKM